MSPGKKSENNKLLGVSKYTEKTIIILSQKLLIN